MKKKLLLKQVWEHLPLCIKILRVMRCTLFLFLLSILQTFALNSHSQSAKISLDLKNSSIKEVLYNIEQKSEYYFLFNSQLVDVDKKVDLVVNNQTVEEVLHKLFEGQDVSYTVMNRQIIIQPNGQEVSAEKIIKISGKVTDISGAPLPGVTVVVKGTTNGTISNFEGVYTISNVPSNGIIQFSFVGMKMQEISVEGKTSIDVVMEEDAIGIEEVVAIGYGTVRRKDLTGSVVSVSGQSLKDVPVTSAAEAIVGRMAGVQVTKTEGSPDADIKIRIRGGGSITQDNSPLYIVDGFPVDNINDIAPTDIASIDVLKDASSTAIYGARGANGVILITTKGGFEGKGKVTYNTYYGVKEIANTIDVLNPYEYVLWQYELNPETAISKFGNFQDFGLYKQIQGTDWQDVIFGRTGTSMYHNIAFSGGTKTSKYNISLTQNDEKEIMIGSGYSRTNLNVSLSQKVNSWLTIDLNSRLSDYYLKGAGTSANRRLADAVQFRPVEGLSEFVDTNLDDGDYEASSAYVLNPLKQTNDDYRRLRRQTFNFNGAATIQISKDLKYRFEYGTQFDKRTTDRFYGLHTGNVLKYAGLPIASIGNIDGKSYRIANVLTFRKKNFLPDNSITVVLGEELNYSKSKSVTSSAKYFPEYIDAISALSMMELGITDPTATSDNPGSKISSYFGRVNYDYKNKYLFSATFRADGSSKFAPGNQWGYFPSAALAWRISDENFLDTTNSWLNDLKLRISYGESGNNRISDNAWQKTFSVSSSSLFLDGDGESAIPTAYLQPNGILSNPGLKWETTVTRNVGIDFGFFKQRLSGSFELYKNTTKDLLISATVPSSSGYSKQWQNIGQTSNKGVELVLNGVLVEQKDFRLSMSMNIGINKNRIDKLGETKRWEESAGAGMIGGGPTGDYVVEEGGQVGIMYGYETDGMYSFDDFNYDEVNKTYTLKEGISDNSAIIGVGNYFMPGILKFKDQDGDFMVDALNDKVIVGNANPKHSGGFNLTAQYKGFDFSAFFNWVYGNDIYNANKLIFNSFHAGRMYKNIFSSMDSENRFTYIDKTTGEYVSDPEELANLNENATIWSPRNGGIQLYSWVVEDGSFLRLNNVTLGYTLPENIVRKLKIEKLRIYTSGYNLWIWTNYSGYDPEVDTQRGTPLTPGIDYCAYPRSRSFVIGLNVEF